MVRRGTRQHTEALVHAQASPVTAGEGMQLGVAFEHKGRPLGGAELSKSLVSSVGAVDQTRILLSWD
jgi:hypothetical protein